MEETMDETITTFTSITGAGADVARGFLQLAGGNFERAVGLYFESPELASGVGANMATGAGPPSAVPAPAPGHQHPAGVIHISDDDDDDDGGGEDEHLDELLGRRSIRQRDSLDHRSADTQAAALAQEEEDAAMAKRLQEELYQGDQLPPGSGSATDMDPGGVRAPIARTTETLVAPDPAWGDDDDDVSSILSQLRRRQPPARSGGPFGQRIWGDGSAAPTSSDENGPHARRLEDLFRPPYDLMSRVTWDEAREGGKQEMKWIMVNLQDMNDFSCQALNRDIWKDQAVRDLVSKNFIFLQYDKDYPNSQEYVHFYFPHQSHENPDNYPHVSIVDPRTGEQVKVWSGRPFPSAKEFHSELAEFLDRYSLAANSKNPVATSTKRKAQLVDVDRMTEEEMLELALKNSLAGSNNGDAASAPSIHDPDALTKLSDKAKGKQPASSSAADAQSPFSEISSGKPHQEPDERAAETTRIQFRHADGRVIRRFHLQDPVRRIYEWLKAEPLEGKEGGIEFELKKMPEGEDLIGKLEDTIEAEGLKQGTVMIEYVED